MPRFKLRGVLERSAADNLWKHTLSRIPTAFGRLVYLASLRDPNSDVYRHHGFSERFGREESIRVLRESHEEVFLEWLGMTMKERSYDLSHYLLEIEEPLAVDHWLRSKIYAIHVPTAAADFERGLFCRDLNTLLGMIKATGAKPVPASSQRK
jgi:hypothetical protein